MAIITKAQAIPAPWRRPAAVQVGDDSIGWRICRATAAVMAKYEDKWHGQNMKQSIQQPRAKHVAGVPPAHVKSINFQSCMRLGRPSRESQQHFKQLVQTKKGVWNEK